MLAELGIRFDQKGTYRLRLSAGFGPGYLFIRENQGLGQPKSALEASDWSHHLGIGFSTWIFDFHVQGLAHSAVARGTRASNLGTQSSEYSTSIGILFGLGLRAPIRW